MAFLSFLKVVAGRRVDAMGLGAVDGCRVDCQGHYQERAL